MGKDGLSEYLSRGYFASDQGSDQVSKTLDFGFSDYSTALAFRKLASDMQNGWLGSAEKSKLLDKANDLMRRAERAYTSLFDSSRGLMVPKSSSGQHPMHFSEVEWGNGYMEGNAWHHSFPPYAIEGLPALYGGKENMLKKLHQLLTTSGNFQVGSYRQEIHEMTEARAQAMGQYSHNNQPCHHILYLFALLGDRATTETMVRQVMERAYGLDFFAGDEDNGEQGAWYVLSALGLFVTTPGTTQYVLGSPLFRHVRITRPNSKDKNSNLDSSFNKYLDIVAVGTSATAVTVDTVLYNNKVISDPTIDDKLLQQDGVLRFVMTGEKNSNNDNQIVPWERPSSSSSSSSSSADAALAAALAKEKGTVCSFLTCVVIQ